MGDRSYTGLIDAFPILPHFPQQGAMLIRAGPMPPGVENHAQTLLVDSCRIPYHMAVWLWGRDNQTADTGHARYFGHARYSGYTTPGKHLYLPRQRNGRQPRRDPNNFSFEQLHISQWDLVFQCTLVTRRR